MTRPSIDAFVEEFEKVAWGAPAATLGVAGGLMGAVRGYGENDHASTTDKILSAGKGALVGGAVGAAAGGGLGLAGKHLGGTAQNWSNSVGNFGKRQVHALTGYVPKHVPAEGRVDYLKSIGIGSGTQEALQAAKDNAEKVRSTTGILPQSWRQAYADWGQRSAQAAHDSNEVFIRNQATSLPGMARAFWNKDTRGETLRAVGKDLVHGGGMMGTAMMGLGVVDAAHGVVGDPRPDEVGMGRGEMIGRSVGNAAGWLLPSPIPVAGQVVGSSMLTPVAGAVGRGADRLLGNRPVQAGPRVVPPGGIV